MAKGILGIHHVTAIAGEAEQDISFYHEARLAQTSGHSSTTEAGETTQARISRAMSAGPAEVAESARIVDTASNGETVVPPEGNNGFTCMPGNPKVIGDPAMCADAASRQWSADFKAHKPKPTNTVLELPACWLARRSAAIPISMTKPVLQSPFPRIG